MCDVSVIVAARDADPFELERAVSSALKQEFDGSIEVVVCDDGSAVPAQLSFTKRRDDRSVQFVRHEESMGISTARNSACAVASGDWLIWLDSDDELLEGAIAVLHDIATRRSKTAFVAGQCLVRSSDLGRTLVRSNVEYWAAWKHSRGTFDDPLAQVVLPIHGGILRHSEFDSIGGFDVDFVYAELTDLILRLAASVEPSQIETCERATYAYYRNHGSHSAARDALRRYRVEAMLNYARATGLMMSDLRYLGRAEQSSAQHFVPVGFDGGLVETAWSRFGSTIELEGDVSSLLGNASN